MGDLHEWVKIGGILVSAFSGLYLVMRGVGNAYLLDKSSTDHTEDIRQLRSDVAFIRSEFESHLRISAQQIGELEHLKKDFNGHIFESSTRNSAIVHLQEKVARIDQTVEFMMKEKK